MKIKKINIYSLYGSMDFEWEFDEKVNILAGINGAYKTTLLNIIKQVTNHEEVTYPVTSVEAEYTDGIKLTYTRKVSNVRSLLANREANRVVVEMIEKEHPEWVRGGGTTPNVQVAVVSYREEQDGKRMGQNTYEAVKKIDYISTFDVPSEKTRESVLDEQLTKLKERYAFYLSDLSKQVTNLFKENGNVSREQVEAINKYRDEFVTIVNDNFKETGKTMSETESDLTFEKSDNGRIDLFKLSAGEKQLMVILLTVLLEKRQEYILLMDEPEISMHIDMQYSLIDNLQKLNPNVQVILSTHSPVIFGSGWGDKVVLADMLLKK